jgi:hypothetical protein
MTDLYKNSNEVISYVTQMLSNKEDIDSQNSYIKTSNLLVDIHLAEKELKTNIDELKRPYKEKLKEIDDVTKQAFLDIKKAKEKIKSALLNYISNATKSNIIPAIKGVTYRKILNFTIIDENAIPREFLKPDETKILNYIKKHNGNLPIKGVEIEENKSVVVRSK